MAFHFHMLEEGTDALLSTSTAIEEVALWLLAAVMTVTTCSVHALVFPLC